MNAKKLFMLIKFFKTIKKVFPKEATLKALKNISENALSTNFNIHALTNDKDIEEFINKFDLNQLQNLTKFFVELYFENFEAIHDSINDLKEIDLINTISKVKGAKITYEMANGINDEQRRYQCISNAQSALNEACSQLEDKIMFYIDKQRKIDSMNRLRKALRGKSIVNDIDNNNNIAKQAIGILLAAVNLHTIIAHDTGDDIYLSVIKPYDEFRKRLLANNTCLLMSDYDVNYEDGFWTNLQDTLLSINIASIITTKMADDPDKEENII